MKIWNKIHYKSANSYKPIMSSRTTRTLHTDVALLWRWCSGFVGNVYENVANATRNG